MTPTISPNTVAAAAWRGSLALAALLTLTFAPGRATAEIGLQWTAEDLMIQIVGEIAPDEGYEAIAMDALGNTRLHRLIDGTVLSTIPAPFDDHRSTAYYLRDVDADGLAEIVCLHASDAPGAPAALGLLDFDRGQLRERWPTVVLSTQTRSIDFMDLGPAEPFAIVVWDPLRIYSSQNSALLFDSVAAIGQQGWKVASIVIDSFDDDAFEEALVHFQLGSGLPSEGGAVRTDLIGDLSAPTSANTFSVGRATLLQNRPNPTSGSTRIAYDLQRNARVRLRVFDSAGRRVSTLIDEQVLAGRHETTWNGRDDAGSAVASGIYFYELDVEGEKSTRKLVQVR